MRMVIDITQLAGWQGKLTGIPRVMYELSSRFSSVNDKTVFIGWDAGRKVFWELSFADVAEKRNTTNVVDPSNESVASNLNTGHLARKLFDKLPESAKITARALKLAIKSYRHKVVQSADVIGFKFQSDDKLLVLWGEWGDINYREAIVSAVKDDRVELYQFTYDMLPLVTPQYSAHSTEGLRLYVDEVYPLCSKLISISKHTKEDVRMWLRGRGLKIPAIEIVRLGENFEKLAPFMPSHPFFHIAPPYIICVGTIETRKNHTLLYCVYKLAKARNINLPKIVVVGRRGWMTENIYDLITNDPDTKDMFIFLHDTSDEELSWIYEHSLFSVYPSHYEGWGLPIAESMAHGVPCVASNTSSMPEIAGDLISYFTPSSTDECLEAICYLLDEKNLAAAREKVKLYKPTSWDETFKQTLMIIGEVK